MQNKMNLADLLMEKFNGTLIDEYGIEHYKLKGKKHDIQRNDRRDWSCSCPAFRWQKKSKKLGCKHVKEAKMMRFNWLSTHQY
jgi:hypothetical protein